MEAVTIHAAAITLPEKNRPAKLTPDQLLEGYQRVFRQVYSIPSIVRRLWGTTAWKSFFYPMNLGFRQSIRKIGRGWS